MKTGIVFKIEGRKAILLKADGSFAAVNVKNGWKVGQTVPVSAAPSKKYVALLGAVAACFSILVIGGFSWKQLLSGPVALVSLDVNPSIELSVNRFDRIVAATALNEEGTRILEETDIKDAACQEALANLLNAEELKGYLAADADVVLTVFASDSEVQASLLSELQAVVDSHIALYAEQVHAEYHAVDEDVVNGAHGHGVSAGKYLYLQELQELVPEADLSEFKHHSIEQIKGEIETCQKEHGMEREDAHHSEKHAAQKGCE